MMFSNKTHAALGEGEAVMFLSYPTLTRRRDGFKGRNVFVAIPIANEF
jgi:hypothetical protein